MIFSIIYGVFIVILGIVMDFSDIFYVNDEHTLNKGGVVSTQQYHNQRVSKIKN